MGYGEQKYVKSQSEMHPPKLLLEYATCALAICGNEQQCAYSGPTPECALELD